MATCCPELDDDATEAAVGTVGDFWFLAPVLPPAAVFDTGTVIVDAEVTATVDATVVLVCDDDDDDLAPPPEEEEDMVDEDAASTYSVEVIVAAFVVVGGLFTESVAPVAAGLRVDAAEEAAATVAAGVDSEPFA